MTNHDMTLPSFDLCNFFYLSAWNVDGIFPRNYYMRPMLYQVSINKWLKLRHFFHVGMSKILIQKSENFGCNDN